MDTYDTVKEVFVQDMVGLLQGHYGARAIEVLPVVIKNHPEQLEQVVADVIKAGMQNQLLYILEITEILCRERGKQMNISPHIKLLLLSKKDGQQWIGDTSLGVAYEKVCVQRQTELMQQCGVLGLYGEQCFRVQFGVYVNGSETQ